MSTADDRMERMNSGLQAKQEESSANKESRGAVKSSSAGKKGKTARGGKGKQSSAAVSVLLWLLRKSIVPLIMVIMLIAGLYIGYVIVGKSPEEDVFKWSTWKHLYDLIFAES